MSVYNAASAEDIREGLVWYPRAYALATLLDPENIARACGIIAVLSPKQHWNVNKMYAEHVYATGSAAGCGMGQNTSKAQRIFDGEDPFDVVRGPKVTAFFNNILDPAHAIPAIDRHAFDIAVGEVTDDKRRGALSKKGVYDSFANVFIDAANIAGIFPSQMQAVTWVTWRRIKGEK
jgi:hypothetical protein